MANSRLIARVSLDSLSPTFEAIRARHGVAVNYPNAVISEARSVAKVQGDLPHITGDREDRTDLNLVTIDPEGSLDLDQAIGVKTQADGWLVHYAIADVAAHVAPGGAIDADTWTRGETVYCPDRRVGLHPPIMSEGFASLLPGQRTKAALWSISVGADGEIGEANVTRVWVTSRHKYSYDQLQNSTPEEAKPLVAAMKGLGDARRKHVRERGGVTLPKPSQEVVDTEGELALVFRAAVGLEDDNAQVSLLTGEAAARLMLAAGVGVLRTMPPAQPQDLERLRRQASALGIYWPGNQGYADVLANLDVGSPTAAAFLTQATRLFRGATWQPFDVPDLPIPDQRDHGALARPYAHVTAPLRRLVDRYGTEVCLAHCAGAQVPQWVHAALPTLGEAITAGVRTGAAVDRECVDAVETAVLAPHVGELFDGVGLDDRTVQLADPAVVARCSGAVRIGERQQVRLVSADAAGAKFAVA